MECGGLTPPWDSPRGTDHNAACQGGVKPPHSKALRAFSCFPGAHLTGMGDCLENTQSKIPLRRLTDPNDTSYRVITQTQQER
jgi:hypothetical protein